MNTERVRIDKWLWAARFYKTRSIAKQAIDGGKVQVQGQRAKASKEIEVGMLIELRQGWTRREVEVLALSQQGRGAAEAALLYRETPQSLARAAREAELRKAAQSGANSPQGKPDKRQRRKIHNFKRDILDDEQD